MVGKTIGKSVSICIRNSETTRIFQQKQADIHRRNKSNTTWRELTSQCAQHYYIKIHRIMLTDKIPFDYIIRNTIWLTRPLPLLNEKGGRNDKTSFLPSLWYALVTKLAPYANISQNRADIGGLPSPTRRARFFELLLDSTFRKKHGTALYRYAIFRHIIVKRLARCGCECLTRTLPDPLPYCFKIVTQSTHTSLAKNIEQWLYNPRQYTKSELSIQRFLSPR